jgi:hypothetical protein
MHPACRSTAEGAALAAGSNMSTTALDVDSRERSPPSEQSVLDSVRDPHLGQDRPPLPRAHSLHQPLNSSISRQRARIVWDLGSS